MNFFTESMGRIVSLFRQLYQETVSDFQMELKAALVDLDHNSVFDLLLKEAWNVSFPHNSCKVLKGQLNS
jgi:hypothetical protein